jgi:hypothetical protein
MLPHSKTPWNFPAKFTAPRRGRCGYLAWSRGDIHPDGEERSGQDAWRGVVMGGYYGVSSEWPIFFIWKTNVRNSPPLYQMKKSWGYRPTMWLHIFCTCKWDYVGEHAWKWRRMVVMMMMMKRRSRMTMIDWWMTMIMFLVSIVPILSILWVVWII